MREIDARGEEGVDNEQIMVKSGLEMIDGWLYLILKCSSTQSPKGPVGVLGQGGTGGGKAFEAPPQNSDQATLYSQELPART